MKIIFIFLLAACMNSNAAKPILKNDELKNSNFNDSANVISNDHSIPDSSLINNNSDNQNNSSASELKPDQPEKSKTYINNPDNSSLVKTDSIFLFKGDIYLADVKKITMTNIYFTHPGEMDLYNVERKEVKMIIYKDGIKEIVNTIKRETKSNDWKELKVTDNPSDVLGFVKAGKIDVIFNY